MNSVDFQATPEFPEPEVIVRHEKLKEIQPLLFSKNVFILSGEPGCGKTVFAAQMAHTFYPSFVWINLTEEDLDPVHLCKNLYMSIQNKFTRFSIADFEDKAASGELTAIQHENYIRDIIRNFRKSLKKPAAIVFDGAEILPSIGLAHNAVKAAIGLASKNLHFIVTSRKTFISSNIPGKYSINIFNLGTDFFLFRPDEFRAYALNYLRDLHDFSDLNTIYTATEGWAKGITAAFQITRAKNRAPDMQELSQYLGEYFNTADLLSSDSKIVSIMYLMSLLDEINLDFAIKQNSSTKIANHLIHMLDNCHFIYRAGSTAVFRLKPLYKKWLAHQCGRKLNKNDIELFLNSAAAYYVEKNDLLKALRCYIRAGTYSKIEELLKNNIDTFIAGYDIKVFSEIFSEIPFHILLKSIWMGLFYGISIKTHTPDKAAELFLSVRQNLTPDKKNTAALICSAELAEYFVYVKGDMNTAAKYQHKLAELAESESFTEDILMYAYNSLFAVSIFTGSAADIKKYLDISSALCTRTKSSYLRQKHIYFSGLYNIVSLKYKTAADSIDQMIKSRDTNDFPNIIAIYILYAHTGAASPMAHLSTKLRENYREWLDAYTFQKVWLDMLDAEYAIQRGDIAEARKYIESRQMFSSSGISEYPAAVFTAYAGIIDAIEFDETAAEKGEHAIKLASESGISDYMLSSFFLYSGIIYTLLGSFKTAEKKLLQALSLSGETAHDIVSASANAYLSYLYMNIGRKELAEEHAFTSMRFLYKQNRYNFICSTKSVVENLLYYASKSPTVYDYTKETAFRHYNMAIDDKGSIIPVLEINAFGEMQISLGGQQLSTEEFSGNFRIMIAILISSKDYIAHQEVIQSYLWPSSDKEKARRSFDNLMSRFRKLLSDNFYGINPKDYISISNGIVRLSNTKCNADEFITLCIEGWTNFEKGEYCFALKNVIEAKDMYTAKYFPFINDIENIDAKRHYTDRAFLDMLILINKLNSLLPDMTGLEQYISRWLDIYIHETDMVQLAYGYYKNKGDILKCRTILKKFETFLETEGFDENEKNELLYMVKTVA